MEIDAAVVREAGGAFELETVELDSPRADEVLVEIVGVGVCHTDLSARDGHYPTPLPAVFGHEGSGIVREIGADVTHVEPGDPGAVADVPGAIEGHLGGAHYTFEASGDPTAMRQAIESLRKRGTCGVVGSPPRGTEVSLPVSTLLQGRTVRGIVEGDAHPQVFVPELIDRHQRGQFPFEEFVTFYEFENIHEAIADAEAGEAIKPILRM